MKKSNGLMISYILFLFITLVANCFFNWDGLKRIALASTTAGLFFALADWANWRVANIENLYNVVKTTLLEVKSHSNKCISFLTKKIAKNDLLKNKVLSHPSYKNEPEHPFNDVKSLIEEETEELQKHLEYRQTHIEETDALNEKSGTLLSNKIKKCERFEMTWIVCGFLSFFAIVCFDLLFVALSRFESCITVLSFGVIVSLYFWKDVYIDKDSESIKDSLDKTNKLDEKLQNMIANDTESNMFDELSDLVITILVGDSLSQKHTNKNINSKENN